MSPSSSALPSQNKPRSRQSSTATPVPGQEPSKVSSNAPKPSSRPQSPYLQIQSSSKPPHYTVFIRLPFTRGAFEDPPPVEWNAAKDRQLWKLISGGKGDVDWEGLSNDFGVDLGFLVMQGAWLSERHMERMRKQVGRIAQGDGTGSGSGVGGIRMERTGSRESKLQTGSTVSAFKRDSPITPVGGESSPGTSTPQGRVPISRTPSTTTVTQSKITGSRIQQPLQRALRGSSGSGRRPAPIATSAGQSPRDEYYEDAIEHEGPSESDSEEEPSAASRSQAFRRPLVNRKAKQTLGTLGSDGDAEADEDDDDSGGYLPFATSSKPDPAATIRGSPKRQTATIATAKPKTIRENSTATESSASSASMHRQPSTDTDNGTEGRQQRPPGPLSPRHRAQLASMSPRYRKDGSEGSPSMGSSFSDLDDASVTQSALEDALMSNMRTQGSYGSSIGGRMSSLRDALGRRGQ
ncbi:hypothetical protein M409DRAFT_26583 [Zasmidium cellare ATCC 36951]|uniref:Autophagy-related protein 29 n=1 Tax=Zasmidium cellare ATCC 36951 TaxID=1080233 RepID=A0A6A6CA77_ZASCE|nr:uncharacterized protein M409DRAFT_26583 [Zasmidium cellare ATCC 36951]KAF2163138.1 hypothetical protein M409DRAFT_26583 [Zasmidium cellare ATCC 36951]